MDNIYLKKSRKLADKGQTQGKLPNSLRLRELRILGHPESPIKAIRAKCIDCCGGSLSEARKCVVIRCALWPMRQGVNPFYGKGGQR